MEIKKLSNGAVIVEGFGIKLNIEPHYLLMNSMQLESRQILDKIIEGELISALQVFNDSSENTDENRRKIYEKEIISEHIKRIALIERDLVNKLHSDGECIELKGDFQELREFAWSVWKYCTEYGFVSVAKASI